MPRPWEYVRSVEDVWLIWIGGLLLLALALGRGLRRLRWQDCRALLSGEDGAAYSLAYVLTFPIYLLLICLIVECTFLLIVKMGTVYAAYAGARSNIVWLSAGPQDRQSAPARRDRAVVQALAPFAACGRLYPWSGGPPAPADDARQYARAYKKLSTGSATAGYVASKFTYARRATRVQTTRSSDRPDADVTVKVTYESPFLVGPIGRILGHRSPTWVGGSFFTRAIVSEVTLQNEGPKNPSQSLGIDYHVPE